MCNNDNNAGALLPYGQTASFAAALPSPNAAAALEHYRLQLYNYAYVDHRFRYPTLTPASPYVTSYVGHDTAAAAAAFAAYVKFDPRCAYRVPEEPKPQHSYIGLIGMAILSSPDKKLVLSDIYQYILDNYAYFRTRGPGWRNSIRHNLSLNDCFIKAGRSANGKGHYWAIHPANVEDFKKGDFRRRKAQRRVRKHMGLAVPEDDDSPSSTPPPPVTTVDVTPASSTSSTTTTTTKSTSKKRLFDVESLLAPDQPVEEESEESEMSTSSRKCSPDTTGDVTRNPCWPCVAAAQTPWGRGGEMSRWHEAVSRLLIRAQQQQQLMNGNKMVKLHETI